MLQKTHLLAAGLIVSGTAFAQDPPPAGGPVVPQPGAVPQPVDPAELARRVSQNGFQEPRINGERLASLYTELTGRRVTVANAAIPAEFRFVQPGPITYGEAADLLRTAARLEGFVFIPSGTNHDKLVFSPGIATPGGEDLPVITDAADLPLNEQVVTYVMPLNHIKPDEVVRTFTAIVKQFGSYGSIAPVPNAASVVITENTSLIRRLIELKETIDVPAQNVGTRFIKIQYADVQELSQTLNEILNTQQQNQQAGVQRQVNMPQGFPQGSNLPPGMAAQMGLDTGGGAGVDIPIQIVPSPRTNEIFAMGRPVDIVFVESLVKGFDSPTDSRNYLRRKLKFLAVADFLPVAEQALQRAFGGSTTGSTGSGTTGGAGRSGANFGGGGGFGGGGSGFGGGGSGFGGRGGSSGGSGFRTNQFSGGSSSGSRSGSGFGSNQGTGTGGTTGSSGNTLANSAPSAQLVGRTLLVADNITNSIVIQGPPASLEVINQLLDEIDVKAEQVMISCIFGQLALGDDMSYGVDVLRAVGNRGNNAFGGRAGSGTGPSLPLDGTAFDPGDLIPGAGLGLYGRIGSNLNIYLEALQATSKFNVIARPTVFMANNQTGVIRSGTQVAVPANTFESGTTGGLSTNIEYRDVVLDLEVTPLVNSQDEITLQISVLNDEIVGTQTFANLGEVPIISTRLLETTVTVPNNETIVLGGLITTRTTQTKSGIPLLSQIPYIGGLFGTNRDDKDREELLVFIQPKIINDKGSLYDGQADIDSRYQLGQRNRDFIDGPGVLPTREAVNAPIVERKTNNTSLSGGSSPAEVAAPATQRRTSNLPKGFIKNR